MCKNGLTFIVNNVVTGLKNLFIYLDPKYKYVNTKCLPSFYCKLNIIYFTMSCTKKLVLAQQIPAAQDEALLLPDHSLHHLCL